MGEGFDAKSFVNLLKANTSINQGRIVAQFLNSVCREKC